MASPAPSQPSIPGVLSSAAPPGRHRVAAQPVAIGEDEPLDLVLVIERVPERDSPAHRDPDEAGLLDIERVEQSGEHGAIGLHRILAGLVALAMAREIGRDHAVVLGERRERVLPRDTRGVETDAVEQDHILPFAGREISDPD